MQLSPYFQTLWLAPKEANILSSIYKLWARPASQIAKDVGIERTLCYKILQKLSQEGYIIQTKRKSITYFLPAGINQLEDMVSKTSEKAKILEESLPDIKQMLQQLHDKQFSFAPHITLFDGTLGIQQLFDDLVRSTLEQGFWGIKIIASNTLDSISLSPHTLHDYAHKALLQLKKKQISTDIYLAHGITIMDELFKSHDINELAHVPAWNSAINVYLSGHTLYIVIFEDTPYGIKIHSKLLATMMHFLVEGLKIS